MACVAGSAILQAHLHFRRLGQELFRQIDFGKLCLGKNILRQTIFVHISAIYLRQILNFAFFSKKFWINPAFLLILERPVWQIIK